MNPIVLGALVSAGPVLVASAIGAWATVRTARVSADQTELTLATDHARWLRDKQSDVYVAMIRFVQDATMRRTDVIRSMEEYDEASPDVIYDTIASYEEQPLRELLVMAQAYASRDVGEAFSQATGADLAVWEGFRAAVDDGPMVISAQLTKAVELANRLASDLYQTAYEDLASLNLRLLRQQGRGSRSAACGDQSQMTINRSRVLLTA